MRGLYNSKTRLHRLQPNLHGNAVIGLQATKATTRGGSLARGGGLDSKSLKHMFISRSKTRYSSGDDLFLLSPLHRVVDCYYYREARNKQEEQAQDKAVKGDGSNMWVRSLLA